MHEKEEHNTSSNVDGFLHRERRFFNTSVQISPVSVMFYSTRTGYDDDTFVQALYSNIRVRLSISMAVDSNDAGMQKISRGCIGLADEISSTLHPTVAPEQLVERWGVGLQTSKDTIQSTTQICVISDMEPLHRIYQVNKQQLRYNWASILFGLGKNRALHPLIESDR